MERHLKTTMMLALAIFAILISQSCGEECPDCELELTVSPEQTRAGITRNVTLLCIRKKPLDPDNDMFVYLRLMREKMEENVMEPVVRLSANGEVVETLKDIEVESSPYNRPFLKVQWDLATENTFGNYYCEGQIVRSLGGFAIESSKTVPINELVSIPGITDLWTKLNSSLSNCLNNQNPKTEPESGFLRIKTEEFDRQMGIYSFGSKWFEGDFALPMPDTGCPPTFLHYPTFVRFHEESGAKECTVKDQDNLHLATPVNLRIKRQCFASLRFCASSANLSEEPWPEGVYCINGKRDMDCPPGFNSSNKLELDLEDDETDAFTQGDVVWEDIEMAYLPFCCMNASSVDSPLEMPTTKPFYLYRHGGECQRVKGMDIADEYVEIDTEDDDNGDKLTGDGPDIDLKKGKPLRIHLCYYTKSIRRE